MPVGDGRDGVDIGNIGIGVAQSLQIDGLGVGPDGVLHLCQIVGIHKGGGHAELGQGMGEQVVAAAVDGLLGHDVVPRLGQSLDGVGDGSRAGGQGQGRHSALQGCQTLFQHILGGVGEPAVDIARVRQPEPGRGMGGVAEHVGSGLVNGNGAGIGGGIGLLLTHVELKGLKLIRTITHDESLLSYFLWSIHVWIPGIRPNRKLLRSRRPKQALIPSASLPLTLTN